MLIDITDKLTESQVEHLTRHDALTGLPNRLCFTEHLADATGNADVASSHAALILIYLDHFKSVNDTHGHPIGDSLLQTVTERLAGAVRAGDTVARLGGDEFAIVVPGASSREGIQMLAWRLSKALVEPANIGGTQMEVSASLGLAVYPDNAGTVDLLIRHANLELYEAKEKGRDTVCSFHPKLKDAATHRVQMEGALRNAIRNDDLLVHYQPQFDLRTGQIHCVEALLRWYQEGPVIAPDEFIAVAERSGLIRTLGAWVFREACQQQALWRAREVKIAINVSPTEANAEDFVAHLDQALAEFRVPAETIEFEITEGLVIDVEGKPVQNFLRACRSRGIDLAIDDFGTGYSSLSYLARLPISKIKTDRSFLSQIDRPDALIEALVTLGHRLGKRVVAEGVETTAQMRFLRSLGCDDAQGFLLRRPGTAAEINPVLSRSPTPQLLWTECSIECQSAVRSIVRGLPRSLDPKARQKDVGRAARPQSFATCGTSVAARGLAVPACLHLFAQPLQELCQPCP